MWFRHFILLFIAIAIAEVYVLIGVGGLIGTGPTIALIILTGVIGVNMLKGQGISVFARFQEKLATGQAPAEEMVEGVLLVVSGAFLITPGFLTDTLGFLWLIPQSRDWFAKKLIKLGWFKSVKTGGFNAQSSQNPFESQQPKQQDDGVIEGEYERKD
ncbi:FxsA family protein [Kangiella sp. HZ709]|uniref:FxsA family protein n=1 Tax=Kangiella sp. HZ709 TaxID=2666328 RepID=UPI0012AF0B2C|nr:FxsA family protein [Kangiella sp. HZ709]MRX28155.1 FxsA family protein [Kangiella sp. HZ709]